MRLSLILSLPIVALFLVAPCVGTLSPEELATRLEDEMGMSSAEMTSRLSIILERADADNDGFLTADETRGWLKTLAVHSTLRAVAEDLKSMDINDDGFVSADEMRLLYTRHRGELSDVFVERVLERFDLADKDRDGKLSPIEAAAYINPTLDDQLLDFEVSDILQAEDRNGDSLISLDEFILHVKGVTGEEDIPLDEIAEIHAEFSLHDANKDGILDASEVKTALLEPHERLLKDGEEEAFSIAKDQECLEDNAIVLSKALENAMAWVTSSLSDMGELIRFPSGYRLEMPFEDIAGAEEMDMDNDDVPWEELWDEDDEFDDDDFYEEDLAALRRDAAEARGEEEDVAMAAAGEKSAASEAAATVDAAVTEGGAPDPPKDEL